jgi:hydrogenase maturation protease
VTTARTLVAGIGNVFLGDDGFGVEVARRLAERPAKPDVHVCDFGIRGVDLTYALLDGFERVILVDAAPRGGAPGTLYVIEPDLALLGRGEPVGLEAHRLDPARALAMARSMGAALRYVRVVGCEPARIPDGDDVDVGLSREVAAAVDEAVALIEELLEVPDA